MTKQYIEVAIPCPLLNTFDYIITEMQALEPGTRVRVPFGRREVTGVVLQQKEQSSFDENKLKPLKNILDHKNLFTPQLFKLLLWAADYYHHPIGEVFASALPTLLRQGKPAEASSSYYYQLTEEGKKIDPAHITRAPNQVKLLQLLQAQKSKEQLIDLGYNAAALKTMISKGWVVELKTMLLPKENLQPQAALTLTTAQQEIVDTIHHNGHQFKPYLLYGITGSGKTEVYFQAMQHSLALGKQVLVLIPEISLTPQTINRFKQRFKEPIVALHSGLNDKERLNAWMLAKLNKAKIIIGTRSAIFTPCPNLGMIVIDEEHDSSFKQQEGFRYHARDLAVMLASYYDIPIILGSATPSLESLHNANQQRYQLFTLNERPGNAKLPDFKVIDLNNKITEEGLAPQSIEAIKHHLDQNSQVLIFINRRGFAPVLFCQSCKWKSACERCDSFMVYHKHKNTLCCHHCGSEQRTPRTCPECQSTSLMPLGQGTQRLQEHLASLFPEVEIIRVDRDSTRGKGKLQSLLDTIKSDKKQILIGTQMLAKGHHFPNVTLVLILDIDGGFYSADFRATERTGQLIMQVAGRAGRAEKPGQVLLQTHEPQLPLLEPLQQHDYMLYANMVLEQRHQTLLPPYTHMAVFRAEAKLANKALEGLQQLRQLLEKESNAVTIFGPMPTMMQRKAGFYRAQLIIQANMRKHLHQLLQGFNEASGSLSGVRLSLDVDPLDSL